MNDNDKISITLKVKDRKFIKQVFSPCGYGCVIIPLKSYSRIKSLNPGQKEVFESLPLNETLTYSAQDIINEVNA